MTEDSIQIEFIYRDADLESIRGELQEALNGIADIECSRAVIKPSTFGNVRILSYNELTDHWPLSQTEATYEDNETKISVDDTGSIQYTIPDIQYLRGGPDHPLDVETDEPLREFLDIITTSYAATDTRPTVVYSMTPDTPLGLRKPPITAELIAKGQLSYLPWLTIFSPPMVEEYGKDTLLSAPAWTTEELPDGSVLVVCHDDVIAWDVDCHSVADHIGLEPYHERG